MITRKTALSTLFIVSPALCLLAACSSTTGKGPRAPEAAASMPSSGEAASAAPQAEAAPADEAKAQPTLTGRMGDAVVAPLGDLNLIKAAIPDILRDAQAAPYALPPEPMCPHIATQVKALDMALGADLDVPKTADNPSVLERGVDVVGDASVSAVRNTTTGILPFRGWVRKLTGAERHSRKVAAAITAGSLRRAYLKGYAKARGCEWPGQPPASQPAPAATPAQP